MMPTYDQEKTDLAGEIGVFLKDDPKGKKLIDDFLVGTSNTVIVNLDDLAAFQKKTYDDLMDNASLFGMAALEKAVVDAVFNGDKQIDKSNISITGTMEKTLVHKICAEYIGKII